MRRALRRWYRAEGRHGLPWRLTRDPYAVLVSEVMLQQTQVERVLPYYARWLERWPVVEALAAATPAEAIREWSGLGYNRRAVNLHRAAVIVVEQKGAQVPIQPAMLQRLPGIGQYSAAAVACFAGDASVPVVETNIARVLSRALAGVASQRELRPQTVLQLAADFLPRRHVRDHNLALMDLGAMVCTVRSPSCASCPLRSACAWRKAGSPDGTSVGTPAPRFEVTSRFARGRIVDALRLGRPLSHDDVAGLLPPEHGVRAREYLAGLVRDGLAERVGGQWVLPGHGSRSIASPKL